MPVVEGVDTWGRGRKDNWLEQVNIIDSSHQLRYIPSVSLSEPVLSRWTARLEPSVMMKRLTANMTSRAGSSNQDLNITRGWLP